jgi:hypothetical protein
VAHGIQTAALYRMPSNTMDIARERWIPFFDEFTRENRGAHATLEIVNGDIGDQLETDDRPLDGVAADLKGSAPAVWITFGSTRSEHLTHGVHDVIAVRLLAPAPPEKSVLEIESSDGTKTLLTVGLPAEFALPPAESQQRRKSGGG